MRKLLFLLLAFILSLLLAIVTLAHSGKTDSRGGHYNRSTGEYHYHHGYSAHDHYDMDGDGVKDCPYEFKDKTNHNNNGGTGSKTTSTTKSSISEKKLSIGKILSLVFEIIFFSAFFLLATCGLQVLVAWGIQKIIFLLFRIENKIVYYVSLGIVIAITVTIISILVLKTENIIS